MEDSPSEGYVSSEDGASPTPRALEQHFIDNEEHFPALIERRAPPAPHTALSYASVVVGETLGSEEADDSENAPGPGPQPLRGISGFPAQQASQTRNNPLSSARMPNGKLGTAFLKQCLGGDESLIMNSHVQAAGQVGDLDFRLEARLVCKALKQEGRALQGLLRQG
jgi:hypothetical protein